MKSLPLLLALFFFSITIHAQDQQKLLEHAYKTKSKKELKQFFDNWHKEIHPISDSEFAKLNDLQKETYMVFRAFYHKIVLENQSKWWDSIYGGKPFLVVKNSVKIYRMDNISENKQDSDSAIVKMIEAGKDDSIKTAYLKEIKKFGVGQHFYYWGEDWVNSKSILIDSIENFRPYIDCQGKMPLYLNIKYDTILNRFLGKAFTRISWRKKIINPKRATGIFKRKQNFLRNYIYADRGNSGWDWYFISFPEVDNIYFDKSNSRAMVDFDGCSAVLKKEHGQWKFVGYTCNHGIE